MATGIVRSPGVNLLLPSDPSRRIRTLEAGSSVEVLDGKAWLRVAVDGIAGLVPAAAVEFDADAEPEAAEAALPEAIIVDPGQDDAPVRLFTEGSCFVGDPIVAHVDFHPALRRLDQYASAVDARIHVTHSFRRRDAGLVGTVVPAAKRSNHLVGHAIDMNIVLPGEWLDSQRLRSRFADLPAAARELIEQIRQDRELRWGGDFVRPDPVHVDDDLYRRDPEQWMRKLREI